MLRFVDRRPGESGRHGFLPHPYRGMTFFVKENKAFDGLDVGTFGSITEMFQTCGSADLLKKW